MNHLLSRKISRIYLSCMVSRFLALKSHSDEASALQRSTRGAKRRLNAQRVGILSTRGAKRLQCSTRGAKRLQHSTRGAKQRSNARNEHAPTLSARSETTLKRSTRRYFVDARSETAPTLNARSKTAPTLNARSETMLKRSKRRNFVDARSETS